MKLPRRNFLHLAAGVAALPAVSRIASAQAYPTRPVRVIVLFAPAGGSMVVRAAGSAIHYREPAWRRHQYWYRSGRACARRRLYAPVGLPHHVSTRPIFRDGRGGS
jgi:hypothetical protein